jgi:glycerol-3-phosphate cytidylyltransferase-like family protein
MFKPTATILWMYRYARSVARAVFGAPREVVYVDVCGDMYHYGHVRMLAAASRVAKMLCMPLVVGLHSDETIISYKRRPVMTMAERSEVIASNRHVDAVLLNAPLTITESYMRRHGIEMVMHGHTEADEHRYADMYAVPVRLGKFLRLPYTETISTTKIIERCSAAQAVSRCSPV